MFKLYFYSSKYSSFYSFTIATFYPVLSRCSEKTAFRKKIFLNQKTVLLNIHENLIESNKFSLFKINVLVESTKYSDLVKTTKQFGRVDQILCSIKQNFSVHIMTKFYSRTKENFVDSTKSLSECAFWATKRLMAIQPTKIFCFLTKFWFRQRKFRRSNKLILLIQQNFCRNDQNLVGTRKNFC